MSHTISRALTTSDRKAAAAFVNSHHSYIKWADRPARKLYWLLHEHDRLVGVFGLSSAFSRPKAVQEFMAQHNVQFNELGNNIVFAMHGHEDKNAGSRLLAILRRDARVWWKERYGDELKAMQTFILPPRTGAVYKADNWLQLGSTTGGATYRIRTLYGADREKYPNAEIRTFKSGEVKYLLREWTTTDPKLMYIKLLAGVVQRERRRPAAGVGSTPTSRSISFPPNVTFEDLIS